MKSTGVTVGATTLTVRIDNVMEGVSTIHSAIMAAFPMAKVGEEFRGSSTANVILSNTYYLNGIEIVRVIIDIITYHDDDKVEPVGYYFNHPTSEDDTMAYVRGVILVCQEAREYEVLDFLNKLRTDLKLANKKEVEDRLNDNPELESLINTNHDFQPTDSEGKCMQCADCGKLVSIGNPAVWDCVINEKCPEKTDKSKNDDDDILMPGYETTASEQNASKLCAVICEIINKYEPYRKIQSIEQLDKYFDRIVKAQYENTYSYFGFGYNEDRQGAAIFLKDLDRVYQRDFTYHLIRALERMNDK